MNKILSELLWHLSKELMSEIQGSFLKLLTFKEHDKTALWIVCACMYVEYVHMYHVLYMYTTTMRTVLRLP